MAGVMALITAVIKLVALFFSAKLERDARKRKRKEELSKELKSGIKNKDISSINSTIGRINRMR